MTDQNLLAWITSRPGILAGKPTVRGTRLSVEFILNLLAHGVTQAEILHEYEGLAPEDLVACLLFASESLAADKDRGYVRPRQGWAEQFQRMGRLGDDGLLDGKDLSASSGDEKEWQW